jgi:hypothetical protein
MENARYWLKNKLLLFAKCLKMHRCCAFAFKVCKMCYYDPNNFFHEKYQFGCQKNAEFYADFKFLRALMKAVINEFLFDTHKKFIFFRKKIIPLFANFKCKCEKTVFFKHLAKSKKFFFAYIYHSPFDSYLNSKNSRKLKPPFCTSAIS